MGRFLDATGAAAKTAAEKAASGRFLKLAEDSTDSVPAESTGTPIPGVKQVKGAVSTAGKYWGPQFERAAKTPAGQMILNGFHVLGRGASEILSAAAGAFAYGSGGQDIGPIKASSPEKIARFREIQAKNLAARNSTKVSLDTTPPFVHYQPGSENVIGSDIIKANFPSMEPGPDEPFLANTFQEIPGSVLGNIKRAGDFAADVVLDPTTYIHGPGLTKVGKTAEKVEAATRAGEKIGLKSLVAQDLAKSMGEKATPAMILKAKKGRFGKLADTFAEQVQQGQANVVSFKPPLTNVEIPLLPRGVATGVAQGAGAIGEAVGKLPLAKEFRRLFSVKTGNKEYDKLFQEYKDLREFRSGATLEQGQELAKRTAALAKKLKISPDELNRAITAGTEVKGKIAPTAATGSEPYISKVPGMGGMPGDEGFAKQVDKELAGATQRDALTASGGYIFHPDHIKELQDELRKLKVPKKLIDFTPEEISTFEAKSPEDLRLAFIENLRDRLKRGSKLKAKVDELMLKKYLPEYDNWAKETNGVSDLGSSALRNEPPVPGSYFTHGEDRAEGVSNGFNRIKSEISDLMDEINTLDPTLPGFEAQHAAIKDEIDRKFRTLSPKERELASNQLYEKFYKPTAAERGSTWETSIADLETLTDKEYIRKHGITKNEIRSLKAYEDLTPEQKIKEAADRKKAYFEKYGETFDDTMNKLLSGSKDSKVQSFNMGDLEKIDNAANIDDLFANVDDGAAKEVHMQFDALLSEAEIEGFSTPGEDWDNFVQSMLDDNPNPTADDIANLAKTFIQDMGDEYPNIKKFYHRVDEILKEAKKNYPEDLGGSDYRKLPDIGGAYNDAKAAFAKKVEGDLIAEKPKNLSEAKGYLGKWLNYSKEFLGLGLSDDSKLSDPRFLKMLDTINTTFGSSVVAGPFGAMTAKQALDDIVKKVTTEIYGAGTGVDSYIAANAEFLQDLLLDKDRLVLGNLTPRKYQPDYLINAIVPKLKGLLAIKFMDNGNLGFTESQNLAAKAMDDLFNGRPVKINDTIFGKDVDYLSDQHITGSMIARGAIGQEQPGENLFKKIQRMYPNIVSNPFDYTKQTGKNVTTNPYGLSVLGWTGMHTRTFLTASHETRTEANKLLYELQNSGLGLPKEIIKRARAIINLAPIERKLALKYEDAAVNAVNYTITRNLNKKISAGLSKVLKDPNKAIQLRNKIYQFEDEAAKALGVTKPSLMYPDAAEAFKKNVAKMISVYSEALTGSYKNMSQDVTKLNEIAVSTVRDLFEINPNDLINTKLVNRLTNRDPKEVYDTYLKWVKQHEAGHRLLSPSRNGIENSFYSVLPKEMRDEYAQIFRNDKAGIGEIMDQQDATSIYENFANANGFYLTLPKVMKEVAPIKFEFFRKIYTPGLHLEPADMVSAQSIIDTYEKTNPLIAGMLRKELPKYFDGTTTNFYSRPLSGDPALDSIIANIKEMNAKQLALEKTSGVKVTPLLSDTDYIAHAMTPEARDMVMERLNAAGKLPRAITAKEFSNKLANAVRRDFTTINKKKAEEFFNKGIIDKKQFREIKGEDGLAYLDRMLEKGQLTESQYTQIVHSMTVQEVNEKAAAGQLKILGGKKVAEFFHEDPVFSTTIRGIRGERARTSAEFYTELKNRGLAVPSNKAPIGWIEPNIDEMKGFSVEPEVANHLNTYRKAINDPQAPTEFLRLFDQTQNLWKSWTLAIFPAYHTRNMVGNSWNNYLAGVRNPVDYKLAADIQRRKYVTFRGGLGKVWDTDTALAAAKKHGIIDRGWVGADIQRSISDALEQPKLLTLSRRNTILQQGLKLGRSIENNARMAHFVAKLKEGYTAAEAAASVKKYLFDYDELTQFERNTMKRLFPFYTWTRKNLPLQIEHLIQRPGRYSILDKASHEIQTPDKPMEKYLPQWMLENYPQRIRFNKKSGDYEYFLLSSWLPAADIVKVFNIKDTAASMLTPLPKELLQQMFNYDVFLKRKIENVPGEKVNFLGKRVPARIAHAAKIIRLLNEADKLSKPDVDLSTKIINLATGKLYPFNEQQGIIQNKFSTDDEIQAIEQGIKAANKAGDQAEVQRLYRLLQLKAQEY
jgi:hypothetical protein